MWWYIDPNRFVQVNTKIKPDISLRNTKKYSGYFCHIPNISRGKASLDYVSVDLKIDRCKQTGCQFISNIRFGIIFIYNILEYIDNNLHSGSNRTYVNGPKTGNGHSLFDDVGVSTIGCLFIPRCFRIQTVCSRLFQLVDL